MTITLDATTRQETGKNVARRLRAAGNVPATLYGADEAPVTSTVVKSELAALIRRHGRSKIITLNLDGKSIPVKIASLQLDPVREVVIHADFMRVRMNELAKFSVPLRVHGEPDGVKNADGILDVVLHNLEIRCLPGDLPEAIDVDVTALGLGSHLSVSDLKLDDKIEVLTDADAVIATCISPRDEAVSTGEAPAEPEVIKKGKTEE